MVVKKLMETAWDMWVSGCEWRHREGNRRDCVVEEELNNCIREEFHKGDKDLSDYSRHLIDCDLDKALNFPILRKKIWFNSMEAARGRVPMTHAKEREMQKRT